MKTRSKKMEIKDFKLHLFQFITIISYFQSLHGFKGQVQDGYIVMIDAGSSGSRVYVYKWALVNSSFNSLQMTNLAERKVEPGIDNFADRLMDLPDYLFPLIDEAAHTIPEERHKSTPIYIFATGGARQLPTEDIHTILAAIEGVLSDSSRNPFRFTAKQVKVLSGEEEGLFSWLSVNFLRGYFTGKVSESVGVLEMGGASTQITFLTDGDILANKFPVFVGNTKYPLYTHSFLEYGLKSSRDWITEALVRDNPGNTSLKDPCRLHGDEVAYVVDDRQVTLHGSGDPVACEVLLNSFVYKLEGFRCSPKPCSIGGVYQPNFKTTKMFYAISAFEYTLEVLNVTKLDGSFIPQEIKEAAYTYCKQPLEDILRQLKLKRDYISGYCLGGLYIPLLLTKGYGFSEDTDQLRMVTSISDRDITWTMGAALYELNSNIGCDFRPRSLEVQANSAHRSTPGLPLFLISILSCALQFD